jgi:hypothetical protein
MPVRLFIVQYLRLNRSDQFFGVSHLFLAFIVRVFEEKSAQGKSVKLFRGCRGYEILTYPRMHRRNRLDHLLPMYLRISLFFQWDQSLL